LRGTFWGRRDFPGEYDQKRNALGTVWRKLVGRKILQGDVRREKSGVNFPENMSGENVEGNVRGNFPGGGIPRKYMGECLGRVCAGIMSVSL